MNVSEGEEKERLESAAQDGEEAENCEDEAMTAEIEEEFASDDDDPTSDRQSRKQPWDHHRWKAHALESIELEPGTFKCSRPTSTVWCKKARFTRNGVSMLEITIFTNTIYL